LLDLNLDGSAMEIDLDLEVTYSVRDAIKELFRLERSVLMDVLPKHKCGLSLLALVSGAGETDEVSPQELATLLSTLRSIFPVIVVNAGCLRASYSHPYLVPLCDHVLIVTSQLMRSVKASRDLFENDLIYEKSETKFSLVISRYDAEIALSPEQIGARLALPILGIIPRAWVLLANGHNAGIPPAISAPRSPYARAIHALADKLMSGTDSDAAEVKAGTLPQIRALVDGLRKTTRPA
jgi:pilus assembly protein CpaE